MGLCRECILLDLPESEKESIKERMRMDQMGCSLLKCRIFFMYQKITNRTEPINNKIEIANIQNNGCSNNHLN